MTQVSEIEIVPVKPANGLVGFASCVLDNKLFLGSIAIYTRLSTEGYRCVYPTKNFLTVNNYRFTTPSTRKQAKLLNKQ